MNEKKSWQRPKIFHAMGAVILVSLTFSCQRSPEGISVEDAWSMPVHVDASAGASNGVVYLTIRNGGGERDRLMAIETDVCESAQIHRTTMEHDRMMMQPLDAPVEIAAGGALQFQPRGLHIMLIGLRRSLVPGERIRLVLHFEKAGNVEAFSQVRNP